MEGTSFLIHYQQAQMMPKKTDIKISAMFTRFSIYIVYILYRYIVLGLCFVVLIMNKNIINTPVTRVFVFFFTKPLVW